MPFVIEFTIQTGNLSSIFFISHFCSVCKKNSHQLKEKEKVVFTWDKNRFPFWFEICAWFKSYRSIGTNQTNNFVFFISQSNENIHTIESQFFKKCSTNAESNAIRFIAISIHLSVSYEMFLLQMFVHWSLIRMLKSNPIPLDSTTSRKLGTPITQFVTPITQFST